jgi:hypothetical protein
MAGYAGRVPIAAQPTHLLPVAEAPDSVQAEPVLLGSKSVAEVIATAMGQITDEEKKVPMSSVQGLDTAFAGIQSTMDDIGAAIAAILSGGD